MGAFTKRWIIRKRRTRKEKINLLRKRYAAARTDADRNAVIKKVQKVAPHMLVEQFVAPLERSAKQG